ncbi:MAG: hypothetical protein F2563_03805 [Actinobacteria bacterium]|uniref:Unannotated protein n=1 Tax=freshwater metagenome TaxID=449393 RepID=A0A6J6EQ03_9ZZZZ|nr:hypothetical protein [Actinomycetota bacterium]
MSVIPLPLNPAVINALVGLGYLHQFNNIYQNVDFAKIGAKASDLYQNTIVPSATSAAAAASDLYHNVIAPSATGAAATASDLYQNTIVPTATGAATKAGEMYSRLPTVDYVVNGPKPTYLSMLSKYATENPLIASAAALGGLGLGSYGLYKLYNKATAKKKPVKKTRRARKVKSTQKTKQV